MTIEIKGLDNFQKSLGKLSKQMDYALMLTLNDLVFDGMNSMKKEIRGKLNLKNKQTVNAFQIKKATKTNLVATLSVDDWKWQADVLKPHFYGGDRKRKGMEKAMSYAGVMSKSNILTPSPRTKIQSSTYVQMMSYLRLNYKAGYDANRNDKSRRKKKNTKFFIATKSSKRTRHLHPGIYARMNGGDIYKDVNKSLDETTIVSMLRVAKKPYYRKRFDFRKTVGTAIARRAQKLFYQSMTKALRTAR